MNTDQLLEAMMDSDRALYEKILDTPGFALYFNRLCQQANQNAALVTALEKCELAMDTAARHGVGDILPPAYRDSWAAAHEAARSALKSAAGEG